MCVCVYVFFFFVGWSSQVSFNLQSVEEAECERAYDPAAELYVSIFDRSKPPEEV